MCLFSSSLPPINLSDVDFPQEADWFVPLGGRSQVGVSSEEEKTEAEVRQTCSNPLVPTMIAVHATELIIELVILKL